MCRYKISRTVFFQIIVFAMTFLSYTVNHAARKVFSTAKYDMTKDWNLDEMFLATLDTVFMSVYAGGLIISGPLGDRYGSKNMVVIGGFMAGVFLILFGLAKPWGIHAPAYFIIIWACTALAQSTGWPNSVAIMGKWFGRSTRGTVYGFWSSNMSVGNIVGSLIGAAVLGYTDWPYVFYSAAGLSIAGGIWVLGMLPSSPQAVGELLPDDTQESEKVILSEKKQLTIWGAFLIPGVLPYSLCYSCSKLVNYALFFWLPFYLQYALHFSTDIAALLSTWYDFGGIVGGAIVGFITDMLLKKTHLDRSFVFIIMLFLASGQLFVYYHFAGQSIPMNIFLMTLTGILIGGPNNLISSAVSVDIGEHPDLKGNKEAVATIAGVVDGTASVGAAVGQLAVGAISQAFGWDKVFYFFMIITATSGLILVPVAFNSLKTRATSLKLAENTSVNTSDKLLSSLNKDNR